MSNITVWFVRMAMIYFLLAVLLGIFMAVAGPVYPYMQIHVHFNLLGWMSMTVYGVGYHILPRFSGRPLWSDRLSYFHIWLANIGLVGMALGWAVRGSDNGAVLLVSSVLEAVSIAFFVINMMKTIKAAPPPPKPAK